MSEDEEEKEEEEENYQILSLVNVVSSHFLNITPFPSRAEVLRNVNFLSQLLEEAEERRKKTDLDLAPLLEQINRHEDFFPSLYGRISSSAAAEADDRVNGALCRLILTVSPANPKFISKFLYEEDLLERICTWACESGPPLRCYATGILFVGLRDRSIADRVVNQSTCVSLLKRVRLYASKLEKERSMTIKYMNDFARTHHHSRIRKNCPSKPPRGTTTGIAGTPLKHSKHVVSSDTSISKTAIDDFSNGSIDRNESSESANLFGFEDPDPSLHEECLQRLVLLELLYSLECIGNMGEYQELLAPAIREDIVCTILTFMHSKNPMVLSHTLKLTSHLLAHKKFAYQFVEYGGAHLLVSLKSNTSSNTLQQSTVLDHPVAMCYYGFASLTGVMEKLVSMPGEFPESFLNLAFSLLISPYSDARQLSVVFFGLSLSLRVVLEYFDKHDGLSVLLNLIRKGNSPESPTERQLSYDSCSCLRQYFRAHLAFTVYNLRRKAIEKEKKMEKEVTVISSSGKPSSNRSLTRNFNRSFPSISASKLKNKAIDCDEKSTSRNILFLEKYRYSSFAPGHAFCSIGKWHPIAEFSHRRGCLILLEVINMSLQSAQPWDPQFHFPGFRVWVSERAHLALESLRILTLVPSLANELCCTSVVVSTTEGDDSNKKKCGMSILLDCTMSGNHRDAENIQESLSVLSNCVSPHHDINCRQHPYKDHHEYTLTATSIQQRQHKNNLQSNNSNRNEQNKEEKDEAKLFSHCYCNKDDRAQRAVRKLAREKNAIKVCLQLLRYKRNMQFADAIHYLSCRVLLGLSRDRHIAQILERMQAGQILSDLLIRNEPVIDENADVHLLFRACALDLISQVTHRTSNAILTEATDPTVRKIEKANIVARTKVTYDSNQLLQIVHNHLVDQGLHESALALSKEAHLGHQQLFEINERVKDSSTTVFFPSSNTKKRPRTQRSQSMDESQFVKNFMKTKSQSDLLRILHIVV